MPLDVVDRNIDPPMAAVWLNQQPKPFAVAELPLPDPGNAGAFERRQTAYMLHSMAHWQKTIHGYSGIRPALHEALYRELLTFPDERSLRSLVRLGVTYVVIHTELYPGSEWARVQDRLRQYQDWLALEHVAGTARVYSVRHGENGRGQANTRDQKTEDRRQRERSKPGPDSGVQAMIDPAYNLNCLPPDVTEETSGWKRRDATWGKGRPVRASQRVEASCCAHRQGFRGCERRL
jgi:hypothetical protein